MSTLFTPLRVGSLQLENRIVVSPMCQYSAINGAVQPWHLVHLGGLMLSGAGLVIMEATATEAAGRITHGCTGLYDDAQQEALDQLVENLKSLSGAAVGLQLSHAGRRGSARSVKDRNKGESLPSEEGAWQTFGPSPFGYDQTWQQPKEMDQADIDRVVASFAQSAGRAVSAGIDLIEIHAAHGYLLHQFLSPVTNTRSDAYGGSLQNRMRFPLQVVDAVRANLPSDRALGVRVNAADFHPDGLTLEDAVVFTKALKARSVDYVVLSAGNLAPGTHIPPATPGHQVAYCERIKQEVDIQTMAVGLITSPDLAETITSEGRADMVAIARGMLDNPRWGLHAAARLGVDIAYPPQYLRARPNNWLGYPLVHEGVKPPKVSSQSDRPASGAGYDRPVD